MEEEAPSVSPRKLHRIRGVFFATSAHLILSRMWAPCYILTSLSAMAINTKQIMCKSSPMVKYFAWGSGKQIDKGRVQKNHDDDDCRDGNNVLWGVRQN